jgi:hypothetical protein
LRSMASSESSLSLGQWCQGQVSGEKRTSSEYRGCFHDVFLIISSFFFIL